MSKHFKTAILTVLESLKLCLLCFAQWGGDSLPHLIFRINMGFQNIYVDDSHMLYFRSADEVLPVSGSTCNALK